MGGGRGIICPLVEIGLTDLQKSKGGKCPPPHGSAMVPPSLQRELSMMLHRNFKIPENVPSNDHT
jgi:hypothetical protein